MTASLVHQSLHRTTLAIGLAAALAACGGGGGGDTAGAAPATPPSSGGGGSTTNTSVSGKVIDGYVTGATVCLDLNANQTCDASEPTTTSGTGGAYSLDTTGLDAATVAKAYVLVTVPATAKDEDDAGKTLAEAGKKAFILLAPVAADTATAGTMVSPLTTLVAQQMISGGLSSAQATQAVRSQLGLATTGSLNIDFKADTSQQALAVLANVAAVALGELQAAVAQGAPAGSTAQQKLVASLNELSQSIGVLKATLGISATSTAAVSATLVQQAIQATVVALTANASQSIAVAQGTIAGTATTFDALLAQGFGDLGSWNGACAAGVVGCTVYADVHLTLGGNGMWRNEKWRSLNRAAFVKQPAQASEGWILGGSGWVSSVEGGTYAAQADGSVLVTGSNFGPTGAYGRVRMQDVAGQAMSAAGETGSTASKTFPAGAQAYWWSFFLDVDSYHLRAADKASFFNGQSVTTPATLAAFVNGVQTPATGQAVGNTWGWNGLEFSFDGALASQGAVSFWNRTTGAALGKGQYELRTVKGQQVLAIAQVPAAALTDAATRDSYILGEYGNRTRPIFGVVSGAVYQGTSTTAGSIVDVKPGLNKVALNAVLAARGLCQMPDANGGSACP